MWLTLIVLVYVAVALVIVVTVLLHGARPSKTLAWLLAIFTIPVGGILLYLLLGRNRRKNKLLALRKNTFRHLPSLQARHLVMMDGTYGKLKRLVYRNSHFPPSYNHLEVLKDGRTTFEFIFDALENAGSTIHMQYYIFEEGELADRLLLLFERKIRQGVSIRLIYDGIGSFSLSKAYRKKLKKMGVEVYPFLPFRFGRFLSSLNYRNHRKIIVVDGHIAFTGGINISDKYLKGDPALGKWHDMHVQLTGEAARHLEDIFARDWYLVCQKRIPSYTIAHSPAGGDDRKLTQIVSGGPDEDFPSLEQTYFTIINTAKDYVYITNPYIIPGPAIMQALQTAALGGVDVRLLVSGNADTKIVNWSVRSYFEPMLKAGIKIYLFPDGFLHSKIIVSDNSIATIGTANLDDRSFEQNYEVNAIVYNKSFASLLKEDFRKDCNISRMLSYQEYLDRPWSDKLKEGIGKVFSPLL